MAARKKPVTLKVNEAINLEGVDLAPGKFRGTETRLVVKFMGKENLTDPEYLLHLGRADLADIPGSADILGLDLDATTAVKSGAISVV